MLRRGFPNFSNGTPPSFSSFRCLLSSSHSSSKKVAVPALVNSDDEEPLNVRPPSAVLSQQVFPSLLLPRVVVYDGVCRLCHRAALRVLSYLPPPYSALSILLVVPKPIRDSVYDYIAKNRYRWLGRAEACLVLQEKELLERFIDWDELSRK